MASQRILVIEDDSDICELLQYNFERSGYICVTESNGKHGFDRAIQEEFDLIVLDVMLPGMTGLEVLQALRCRSKTKNRSILLLTAKTQESDVVVGFEYGADDYVSKPFSVIELLARVKSLLRRSRHQEISSEETLHLGSLDIDLVRYQVKLNDEVLAFTLTEYKIICELAKNPGIPLSRESLLAKINDENTFVIDRNIDVHIRAIRKKLGANSGLISTIRGVGYMAVDGVCPMEVKGSLDHLKSPSWCVRRLVF